MLLLRLAIRNALRSPTRSGLTALTVLLGTMLLTVGLAWIHGVFGDVMDTASDNTGHVRLVNPRYALREELMPLSDHVADVDALSAALRAVPGVEDVEPRLSTGVTVTVGEELGDVFALAVGASPAWMERRMGLRDVLVDGRLPEGDRDVLMGATTARQLGARVGDEVVLLGQTQDGSISPIKGTVVGIASAGNGLVDQAVYLPLPALQWLADLEGGATEVLVYGADRAEADALARAVAAVPAAAGLEVQAWDQREPWIQFLPLIATIQGTLSGVIVLVTALGVWNTMLMSVLERTDEIGVLRAMGLTRAGAVTLFVIEAVAIALVGGTLGVALGSVGAYWLEVHGISLGEKVAQNISMPIHATMYADLDFRVVATSFSLGMCMALLGSALPALRAASIEPVEAMRQN